MSENSNHNSLTSIYALPIAVCEICIFKKVSGKTSPTAQCRRQTKARQ